MLRHLWLMLRGYRLIIQPRIKFANRNLDFSEPAWVKTTKNGVHIIHWTGK